jgi:hypothetical protein
MKIDLKKGSYTVQFLKPLPQGFKLFRAVNDDLWIDRDLFKKFEKISFNIHFPGEYESNVYFKVVEFSPLFLEKNNIDLFEPERKQERPIKIVFNPKLGIEDTPARIFPNQNPALIEIGQRFKSYPSQVRMFILLHEYGHMFYKTEHKTDLYALKKYLELGYNASMAFWALAKVLHTSPQGIDRITKLFNQLKLNGYVHNV